MLRGCGFSTTEGKVYHRFTSQFSGFFLKSCHADRAAEETLQAPWGHSNSARASRLIIAKLVPVQTANQRCPLVINDGTGKSSIDEDDEGLNENFIYKLHFFFPKD